MQFIGLNGRQTNPTHQILFMTSSDPYIAPTYWQRVNVDFINFNPLISSIKEDIKMLTHSITQFQATD